ncbi:MAG: hypothetical protein RBR87_09045 [Bacteroidales bacterium]|nr:hypothetical protein [Bacteroidales bacterium]
MKTFLVALIFLSCILPTIGQNKAENPKPMKMLLNLTADFDLTEHWYWSNYLKSHNKKSIAKDSTIDEGYRLLYWGKYFSIVEIIKRENIFEVIVDSTPWNENIAFRSIDSIKMETRILKLRSLCDTLICDSEKESLYTYEVAEDDRDNWAFEWKNENGHFAIEGIEVSQEFSEIIHSIMELGNISGYTIYNRNVGEVNE